MTSHPPDLTPLPLSPGPIPETPLIIHPAPARTPVSEGSVGRKFTRPEEAGADCNESPGSVAALGPPTNAVAKKNWPTRSRATTIKDTSGNVDATGSSMLKKDLPNVLPLHLVPLDSFFLADDQPRYPMTSIIRIEFQGMMDTSAFAFALEGATERHPLTRAVIRPAKQGLPCWVDDPDIRPVVDVGPLEKPVRLADQEYIDLTRESGLRFWIRGDEQRTVLTMQVHHACTDGTGVYRFLGDLLALYGGETAGPDLPTPMLGDVDLRLLRKRRTRFTDLALNASATAFVQHGLCQAYDIFGRRITPLALPGQVNKTISPRTEFPGICNHHLTKDEHKQLRAVAAEHGGMLNDLLMAEMYRTIVQWNEQHGRMSPRDSLRIMMPSDLREQQDYPMPATNMTAYTFMTRRVRDCEDFPQLMRSVREQTARIKHEHLGRAFMDTVHFASFGPAILKFLLARKRCISTAILSNIGDPTKRFTSTLPRDAGRIVAGNLIMEDITGVPPLRVKSHATVAVFSYLRKLTLSVRCDPYEFTEEQSQQFIDSYAAALRRHLTSSGS